MTQYRENLRLSNPGFSQQSIAELVVGVYKYFEEINEVPVVYHWTWNLDDINAGEEVKVETLLKCADN